MVNRNTILSRITVFSLVTRGKGSNERSQVFLELLVMGSRR
jgi:hypothetical protein